MRAATSALPVAPRQPQESVPRIAPWAYSWRKRANTNDSTQPTRGTWDDRLSKLPFWGRPLGVELPWPLGTGARGLRQPMRTIKLDRRSRSLLLLGFWRARKIGSAHSACIQYSAVHACRYGGSGGPRRKMSQICVLIYIKCTAHIRNSRCRISRRLGGRSFQWILPSTMSYAFLVASRSRFQHSRIWRTKGALWLLSRL